MIVRDAVPEDAAAACQIMRRSIAELCLANHRNDPAILERWLSNKAPEIFKSWIRPDNTLLVAVEDNRILPEAPPRHHLGPGIEERALSIDCVTIAADRSSR